MTHAGAPGAEEAPKSGGTGSPGGGKDDGQREPVLPKELQGALHSLYSHYEKAYQQWQAQVKEHTAMMPPVFIVVCNNTRSSKLVFDYLAGWEKPLAAPELAKACATMITPINQPTKSGVWVGSVPELAGTFFF